VSVSVIIALLIPLLSELVSSRPGLELRFHRGTNSEVLDMLKKGVAEVGIGGSVEGAWERLDSWPLFSEPYRLFVSREHRLASTDGDEVAPSELMKERLLCRSNCEHLQTLLQFLDEHGARPKAKHDVPTEQDLAALLDSNFGIGIAPKSSVLTSKSKHFGIGGLAVERTVYVCAVAGRQRSMAASTLIKMLRAADWRVVEKNLIGGTRANAEAVTS
jgi:DNA-binding transcriptional LysR family regulator